MDQAKGARGFKNGHILGARSVCGPSITYCTICLHLLHSCKQAAPASCEKHMRNNLLYTLVSSATTMFHCAHGPVLHHQYLLSHKKKGKQTQTISHSNKQIIIALELCKFGSDNTTDQSPNQTSGENIRQNTEKLDTSLLLSSAS